MIAPHTLRALGIVKRKGPLTLDTFIKHMGMDRLKARKVLSNLVERNRVVFVGPRNPGIYRVVKAGEIVWHRRARPIEAESQAEALGVVLGAIASRPLLESCWGGA